MKQLERTRGGFSTFCVFYMLSFLIDATEEWEFPIAALFFMIAIVFIHLRGVSRGSFLIFLVLSTGYLLMFHIPDTGNHNNIFVLCSLFLITAILYSWLRPEMAPSDDDLFELLKPPLRATLAIVYFFAGFHKLNTDFFHPEVGCAKEFFAGMWRVLRLPEISLPPLAATFVAGLGLSWELGGGLMLWIRRLQAPVLLVCWIMHSLLAQMVFFDFSSLAFALMLTFIPRAQWDLLAADSLIRVGSFRIQRTDAYFFINTLAAAAAGLYFWRYGYQKSFHRWQGLALDIGFFLFIWPILKQVFKRRGRVQWTGVPMWTRSVPRWWALFPAFVVFFAMNPYLGLRTAGTFTMFSNLRTEGATSNHLLLGSNPLKVWGYQEDVVDVIDIDDRHARSERSSLKGYFVPVVEFKKRINAWREQGLNDLYAKFGYEDRVYETRDVVLHNPWDVRGRDLEMYLLDFRVVQKQPPNRCRW